MNTYQISFKPLAESDFPLLHTWLNIDFVTKWYAKRKFSFDDVERKFAPRVHHEVPTESFMIIFDDKPIGYIHTYRIHDYPDYALCVLVDRNTAGVDMFIGDKEYIYKGYGKEIMKLFLRDIVFKKEGIDKCIAGPEESNKSAIRAYEKAGFKHLKTVQCPDEEEPECIMVIRKKPEEHVVFSQ